MPFHQIGSDQGLLSAPVELKRLFIVPAERADLIIDFEEFRGEHIILSDNTVPVMQFRVSNKATQRFKRDAHQLAADPKDARSLRCQDADAHPQ